MPHDLTIEYIPKQHNIYTLAIVLAYFYFSTLLSATICPIFPSYRFVRLLNIAYEQVT